MTSQIQIMPSATPSTITINSTKAELSTKFDAYWEQVKDRLPISVVRKAMSGGYRKINRDRVVKAAGGIDVFYRPVLLHLVKTQMDSMATQPLAYNEIKLTLSDNNDATIIANVYMEPEVKWSVIPGIDVPLTIEIKKIKPNLVEELTTQAIEYARDRNVILIPAGDVPLALGHVAIVSCSTIVDGKQWDKGTFSNNKWLMDESIFKDPTVMQHIIGMKSNEAKSFTMKFNDTFGDMAGKDASISIHVNEIYDRQFPGIDDDLAVTNGYANLEAWRSSIRADYERTIREEYDLLVYNKIIDELMKCVTISPIPQQWLSSKAHNIYNEQRELVKTEEELLHKFSVVKTNSSTPINTKDSLLIYFAERAGTMLIEDLVVRSWGIKKGIDGNKQIDNLASYVEQVKVELVKSAVINERED